MIGVKQYERTDKNQMAIEAKEVVSCNCNWGYPCQFNALPTTGQCEATGAWQINDGYFGNIRLEGLRFAAAVWWPGPIHDGNGVWCTIVDEQATKEQREAIVALAQRSAWWNVLGGLRGRLS